MAAPKRIDELTSAGSLSADAAVAIVQSGNTFRATPRAFITEATSYAQSGTGAASRAPIAKLRERVSIEDFLTTAQVTDSLTGSPSVDVSSAIQAAITAATSGTTWGVVEANPLATYLVSSTVNFQNIQYGTFDGRGCTFKWGGNSSSPMFLVEDVRSSAFRRFKILASTTTPLQKGFRIINGNGSSVSPKHRRFEDIQIEGTNGGVTDGFHWDTSGGGGDNNNDTDQLVRVEVNNFVTRAFYIEGQQAKDVQFNHCIAATGTYAVYTNAGFHWRDGLITGMTTADFFINNPQAEPSYIEGLDSENGARLLETAGPSGVRHPVTIKGVRWASNNLNADNRAIKHQLSGGLTVIGCRIERPSGVALELWHNPQYSSLAAGPKAAAMAIGNAIGSTLNNPFTGTNWHLDGNTLFIGATDKGITNKSGGTLITFTDADTTPSVCNGNICRTANTTPTTITTFDDGFPSQEITIIFNDANTTLSDSGTLKLSAAFTSTADDVMKLVTIDGTTWYEVSRSVN